MRKALRMIERSLCKLLGYQAIIYWEGRRYQHSEWRCKDAIEWLSAYPEDKSYGWVITGMTQLVLVTRGCTVDEQSAMQDYWAKQYG